MSWFGWTGEISGQRWEEQRDVRPPWCWATFLATNLGTGPEDGVQSLQRTGPSLVRSWTYSWPAKGPNGS